MVQAIMGYLKIMKGEVTRNICSYMNIYALGGRNYKLIEVKIIRESIRKEFILRKSQKLIVNTKTKAGKKQINERICKIANSSFVNLKISLSDVELYKKCRLVEYEERTGKCAYGYPDVRERYGFNPITGLEEGD